MTISYHSGRETHEGVSLPFILCEDIVPCLSSRCLLLRLPSNDPHRAYIRFKYTGPSIEAVLDRLPTAEVVEQTEDGWIVKAEVFGKGIDMWLKSQGENVKAIFPIEQM